MGSTQSRVTAQGQISVPAEVRKKLGVGPGSILEWEEDGGRMIVRRGGRFDSEDVHRALFGESATPAHSAEELKEGIRDYVRKRYGKGPTRSGDAAT